MSYKLDHCELCPRRCGVDRLHGETGFCGAGARARIFRHGPHHGEEPPVSGVNGSGTIFFSRCTLQCIYCQNYPWSQQGKGDLYDVGELAAVFASLRDEGCHNWNLVSPTPWLPIIREALESVKSEGCLPVVYNTSGFERAEVLEEFSELTDVYLADLRYATVESAREGSGTPAYVEAARASLTTMWRKRGPLVLDGDGIARTGVICRLLVLPGMADEAVKNLHWLADNTGTDIAVSVMSQYYPAHVAADTPGWDRPVSPGEYDKVRDAVENLGFVNGWVQELEGRPPDELLGFKMKQGG